ncbi:MAG: hypothetical protein ACYDH5_18060 [Acidimicrobiales bacterium]
MSTPRPQRSEPARPGDGEDTSALAGGEVTVVIRLALDAEGHPYGSLRRGEAEPVGFAGWLALMAEISAVFGPRGPRKVNDP